MVRTRHRHNVVISSDDECGQTSNDQITTQAPQPLSNRPVESRKSTQQRYTQTPTGSQTASSAECTPRKVKQPPSKNDLDSRNIKSRPLEAFFTKARQIDTNDQSSASQRLSQEEAEELLEDAIDDDYTDFKITKPLKAQEPPLGSGTTRKRSWSIANEQETILPRRTTNHKFLKAGQAVPALRSTVIQQPIENDGPWTQVYAPQTLDELAVHPKKVADVRAWLEGVVSGKLYQRFLVLKGPAGAGKTTTIHQLAKKLDLKILEWHNPDIREHGTAEYVSASSQFADFLSRAGRFPRLDLVSSDGRTVDPSDSPEIDLSSNRLVLLEEFPGLSGSSDNALQSFRSQILQYLASSLSHSTHDRTSAPTPLVLVVSESGSYSSDSNDSMTAHRLLGKEILHHPGTGVIEFNPVAPTIIAKALKLILQKHTRLTGRAQPLGSTIIERLSEIGDIRNAVSTLEYVHTHAVPDAAAALRAESKGSKGKSLAAKRTKSKATTVHEHDERTMSLISSRENTLGLFHAVGKVVYNKREESSALAGTASGGRPLPAVDPDVLLSVAGASTSTFLSAIHENYILSCFDPTNPADKDATMTSVEGCLDTLGDADILGTRAHSSFENVRSSNLFSEGLRQDEIAFHIAVRGMQCCLPYPVKRQAPDWNRPNTGKKYNPEVHRMFYPTDLKLWRKREDLQDTLEHLVQCAFDGKMNWQKNHRVGKADDWTPRRDFAREAISQPGRMPVKNEAVASTMDTRLPGAAAAEEDDGDFHSSYISLASGQSARKLMLLERLPYLMKIHQASAKNDEVATRIMQQVEGAVLFRGIGVRRDDESDDEDAGTSRTFRYKLDAGQRAAAFSGNGFQTGSTFSVRGSLEDDGGEKLVLSDDDIVDE